MTDEKLLALPIDAKLSRFKSRQRDVVSAVTLRWQCFDIAQNCIGTGSLLTTHSIYHNKWATLGTGVYSKSPARPDLEPLFAVANVASNSRFGEDRVGLQIDSIRHSCCTSLATMKRRRRSFSSSTPNLTLARISYNAPAKADPGNQYKWSLCLWLLQGFRAKRVLLSRAKIPPCSEQRSQELVETWIPT